jgi:ABC-type branched-subunit amino acid transport system ATPase component/ABC-type branched-subunit amino acid transport system permease subunit
MALGASLVIGVFQQSVFWSYPRSSTVDVALFLLILVALLLQRRRLSRVDTGDIGGYVAVREVRPIPAVLRQRWEVLASKAGLGLAVAAVVLFLPLGLSHANVILVTYMALYGIIAVSLVMLTGWAGQISLGQFAFVGIGASVTASLLVHAGADMFVALILSAVAGAAAAIIIGIPALRIQGLFLAVTTLAFAVPVSTYLLNSAYFPTLNPHQLTRPLLLKRFDLDKPLTFYYLCLGALVLAIFVARNFRRSRAGRAVLAVRDNERGAAAYAISAVRVKLTAFALSGAMAGFAGGLFAVAERKIGFAGFDPVLSVTVFTMVVVGGLGSIPGALLGAIYVESAQNFLHDPARLLATGAGLLFLLMVAPGGLGEIMYALRDRALRALARARALSVPSLAEHPTFDVEATPLAPDVAPPVPVSAQSEGPGRLDLVRCEDVDAGYGQIQVLFDVNFTAQDGEVVALLGTNGAGKSTVLRVISGLLTPSGGKVYFNDVDVTRLGPIERVKHGIVTVPGGRGVFPSLTVGENLRLAGWLTRSDREFLESATRRVFELFPVLQDRLDTRASALSGGEQQMLTLAQALLCRPRLLMIDELSLGLAPAVVAMLLDVVRRFNEDGITVVLVEQSVNVATSLASRAVFMEKGQVRFSGPTEQLTGRDDLLRSVFLRQGSRAAARPKAAVASRNGGGGRQDVDGNVLEAVGVIKRFGGVTAVDEVDLAVRPGEILGIIGSNGAGKTTLFDVCSGFYPADSGRLLLGGRDVTSLDSSERAELGLGRSFQDARLFPSMTVSETLATALERHVDVRDPLACAFRVGAVADSEAAVARRVEELIELTGLQRYRDAFISELSTGTRRIVELTCAMAHDPVVLLLDEPSSGIAQRESEALAELLLELKDLTGTSLAVIEHDIPLVSSIADHMMCLHLGRVIAAGRPDQVLKDDAVVASYLGSDPDAIARSGGAASALKAVTRQSGRPSRGASKGNGRASGRSGRAPDQEPAAR